MGICCGVVDIAVVSAEVGPLVRIPGVLYIIPVRDRHNLSGRVFEVDLLVIICFAARTPHGYRIVQEYDEIGFGQGQEWIAGNRAGLFPESRTPGK